MQIQPFFGQYQWPIPWFAHNIDVIADTYALIKLTLPINLYVGSTFIKECISNNVNSRSHHRREAMHICQAESLLHPKDEGLKHGGLMEMQQVSYKLLGFLIVFVYILVVLRSPATSKMQHNIYLHLQAVNNINPTISNIFEVIMNCNIQK